MKERSIRCIIIEDEPLAAEILKDYVAALPNFKLVTHCTDAVAALEILRREAIDLIFLDINLPGLKGFDFLHALTTCPPVIITTAYREYALQSFEYNVADYLLKPIAFPRFLKSVSKVVSKLQIPAARLQAGMLLPERSYLFFDTGQKRVRVFLDEINYVESLREYVRIFYDDKSLLTRVKISDIEQTLLSGTFIRIHRSYIVNINKIESYSHDEIEIDRVLLPVSRSYKENLQLRLQPVR